ncbi:TPA: hypothetical protein LLS51_000069 [Serratia marcescens]|nr:hypothetical protein [Serratia marcescens]HBK4670753.1 hypothetical protein [Serratia marcescens]
MTEEKDIFSRDEFINKVIELSEEIDFESLERDGILTKEGAWYRVHKWSLVPENARKRVTAMSDDKKGFKVKFSKPTKKLQQLAAKFQKS